MYLDTNGFLSLSSETTNPKLYSHTIAGQFFSNTDHLVLVRHKGEIKVINRKDLGKTMQLIRISELGNQGIRELDNVKHTSLNRQITTSPNPLTLFSGYDENTGSEYFFFPKIHGERLQNIAKTLDTIDIIDESKGRFKVNRQKDEEDNLLYKLFVLYTIAGKSLIKGTTLSSLKIQLTIPTPFFSRKEILDGFIQDLQLCGYAIAGYFMQQSNGGSYEINTNDYELLDYISKHDKSLASVEKIVTKELADQMSVSLISQYPESKEIIGTGGIKLMEVK